MTRLDRVFWALFFGNAFLAGLVFSILFMAWIGGGIQ